jgi:hypothetical protein
MALRNTSHIVRGLHDVNWLRRYKTCAYRAREIEFLHRYAWGGQVGPLSPAISNLESLFPQRRA